MSEITNIEKNQNIAENQKFDLDTFKSIYYWANAKPDTQIKFFKKSKVIELADIHYLNDCVNKKLLTHKIETFIISLNFILSEGNIKEYGSWDEFIREDWQNINQRVESINLTWDLTFSLPHFAVPQRHTLKVRLGNAIPPKDMFQIMFTSDEPSELMETQAEGLVKVDFINQVLANELIQIVSNWHNGLTNVTKPNQTIRFLERREHLIGSSINYFVPIVFVSLSYVYFSILCSYFNFSSELNILSIQKVAIIFLSLFCVGLLVAKYLSSWFGRKVDKFKYENGIVISKGDENYIKDIKIENRNVLNDIIKRIVISLIVTCILFSLKFVISLVLDSI